MPGLPDSSPATVAFERILCPVDFSDASRHALEHAVAIARWCGAAVSVLHVRDPMFVPVAGLSLLEGNADSEEARLRETAAAMVAVVRPNGVQVDWSIESGEPSRQIVEHAMVVGANLIVIGTHGTTGFEHLLLGSVTEKVLRRAACPVLTVPPRAHNTATLPFRRLLCAIDFSAASLAALDYAAALARRSHATLALLHVVQWPWDEPPAPSLEELPPEQALALKEYRRYVEAIATSRLAALKRERVADEVEAMPRIVHGKASARIVEIAAESSADLIVLGVGRRNSADLLVFGSTANQVVRAATCPVLTLRGEPAAPGAC